MGKEQHCGLTCRSRVKSFFRGDEGWGWGTKPLGICLSFFLTTCGKEPGLCTDGLHDMCGGALKKTGLPSKRGWQGFI